MVFVSEKVEQDSPAQSVYVHIAGYLIHGLTNPNSGSKMKYDPDVTKSSFHALAVPDVSPHKFSHWVQIFRDGSFRVNLVVQIIQDAYRVSLCDQCIYKMGAYETGSACYKNNHVV